MCCGTIIVAINLDIIMKRIRITILTLFALLLALPVLGQEIEFAAADSTAFDSIPADSLALQAADTIVEVELRYPLILEEMPNVHVEQDSLVLLLMEEKIAGVQRGEHEVSGYRVQIYSSNHPTRGKSEALLLEQRVKEAVAVPVYVIYASPSWKVRLGDFRTEEQAVEFRDLFRTLFPDLVEYTYIVRDQIKVTH